MNINSATYRVLTLSSAVGFLFMAADSPLLVSSKSHSLPLFYEVARLLSSALIPAFLLWRNFETLRARRPLIPQELVEASPWYYKLALTGVWLALAFQFVLPAVATFLRYSTLGNSMGTALFLGNASAAGLWFQAPTVFFLELQCASHSYREPNKAMQATCEDARA
jgi:hypothetical protein